MSNIEPFNHKSDGGVGVILISTPKTLRKLREGTRSDARAMNYAVKEGDPTRYVWRRKANDKKRF